MDTPIDASKLTEHEIDTRLQGLREKLTASLKNDEYSNRVTKLINQLYWSSLPPGLPAPGA